MKTLKLVAAAALLSAVIAPPSLAEARSHHPPLRHLWLSRVVRPALPDQLSPQLRPGADARHLRLL